MKPPKRYWHRNERNTTAIDPGKPIVSMVKSMTKQKYPTNKKIEVNIPIPMNLIAYTYKGNNLEILFLK